MAFEREASPFDEYRKPSPHITSDKKEQESNAAAEAQPERNKSFEELGS
jgi:hypothetical protein